MKRNFSETVDRLHEAIMAIHTFAVMNPGLGLVARFSTPQMIGDVARPAIPASPKASIKRWQDARRACCEVGISHPEYMARLTELSNAEHELMRL